MKKSFSTELSYFVGIVFLALGGALIEKAGWGLSMIIAPAYVIYMKVSQYLPFFTFGMATYTFQALLLIAMCLVLRRFRVHYLFSFVTAVFYGILLDLAILSISPFTNLTFVGKLVFFILGNLVCTAGIAFIFHTYISPEVFELFVMEISQHFGIPQHRMKFIYDISSTVLAVILSFIFFGFGVFVGANVGTLVCAVVNGPLIGVFTKLFESKFEFKDTTGLKKYFS